MDIVRQGFLKERVLSGLLDTVDHFRYGEDQEGIQSLGELIEDLQSVIEIYGTRNGRVCGELIRQLKEMLVTMKNDDIISMTDLVEYSILPLVKELVEGGE